MFRTPLRKNLIGAQKMSVELSSPYPAAPVVADFNPTTIPGLLYWFDAGQISGVTTDGTLITNWTDSSGGGRDAVAPTAANRPTFKTNIKNGKPCVRFNGTDNYFRITGSASSVTYTSGSTAFCVLNPSGSAHTGGSWFSCHTSANDYDAGDSFMFHSSNSTQIIHYWRGSRPGSTTDTGINTIGQYTFTVERSGANITQIIRRNKTQIKTFTAASSANVTPTEATIGARFQPNIGGPYVKADILEMLIYNTFIGTTNRDAVENYLATKYAL